MLRKIYLFLLVIFFLVFIPLNINIEEKKRDISYNNISYKYRPSHIKKAIAKQRIYEVAIFYDAGVLFSQLWSFQHCLDQYEEIIHNTINAQEIKEGILDKYDVLIIPGGYAQTEIIALGDDGVYEINKFVIEGGGVFGVCAGGYSIISYFSGSAKLIPAKPVSPNWLRGPAKLKVSLSLFGEKVFGDIDNIVLGYNNGPVFEPYKDPHIDKEYEILAYLDEGVGYDEREIELMVGTPAMAFIELGKGKAVVSNVHPEKNPEYFFIVRKVIHLLANNQKICRKFGNVKTYF